MEPGPGQNGGPSAVRRPDDRTIGLGTFGAYRQANGGERGDVVRRRFGRAIGEVVGVESLGAIETVGRRVCQVMRFEDRRPGRREGSAVPAMDAGSAERGIVEGRPVHYVIDTAIADPPPTLGKLKDPVIFPVAGSQVKSPRVPAAVPQLQFVTLRHRVAVPIR
jgi:hypothetical protein